MKYLTTLAFVLIMVVAGFMVASRPAQARALERGILTSEHIEVIRHNCQQAQSIMTQLHKSDQLLRVNQGQLYESILSKLMAPFNARAGLNRYDTTKLVTITSQYNTHIKQYRDLYRDYDAALQKALKVDCQNQPVAFYDSVSDARKKRTDVHDKSSQLVNDIDDYRDAFEALVKKGQAE